MLNFRKLKQDFAAAILKEGRSIYDQQKITTAKILHLNAESIRISGKVLSHFEHAYESEIEIDRFASQAIHTNCDCPSRFDCAHLAALLYYLEEKIDALIVSFSKETSVETSKLDHSEKHELLEAIETAKSKEILKQDARLHKQILQEYLSSAELFSSSPFFLPAGEGECVLAELALIFHPQAFQKDKKKKTEFQVTLRLPYRSKPVNVANLRAFLDAVRYEEPINIAGRNLYFSVKSFQNQGASIIQLLLDHAQLAEVSLGERAQRSAHIEMETLGLFLAQTSLALRHAQPRWEEEFLNLPGLYVGSLENPLRYCVQPALFRFFLEYLEPPASKLLMRPQLLLDQQQLEVDDVLLLPCAEPGMVYQDCYYRFHSHIRRMHLLHLKQIREMTIPEPLFGTFIENALPELRRFAEIANGQVIERFVTLPYASTLKARCALSYLDGELEATLFFAYDGQEVPFSTAHLTYAQVCAFVGEQGIVARNLAEEKRIADALFQDFSYNQHTGSYLAKTEKKIVEFMTEIIPRYQPRVEFECPQNLLDQFVYDTTSFELFLDASEKVGCYEIDLKVEGALSGVRVEVLWECVTTRRSYLEIDNKARSKSRFSKILVLDLDRISKLVQLFDELGITLLTNHKEERPLWNLVAIDEKSCEGLPVQLTISKKLKQIRSQMLGETVLEPSPIPAGIGAILRPYQLEGVHWLERLRHMFLNGILADDMGLGKTAQAIAAISQHAATHPGSCSLIVCPTSLLYNWKEEIHKFCPSLRAIVIDGVPGHRKKALANLQNYDLIITSYTLLQKDIDIYEEHLFSYAILDEAQHIKNRGTRNARSVKAVQATHRLILTGTPIENSLEELWSLMDFLMPGLLSSYDRFLEKYVRLSNAQSAEHLKRKISPFILRRMKSDVLHDLPPISEITYHCQLFDAQKELYRSYAESARNELVKLVERDGFDKVQIHVLATLTRLKQICCHPAIFAKEQPEIGDSAKYEMLLELLQTLIEGGHRSVIFSQYTKMLHILRADCEQRGIRFCYLDGTSKNRLAIVKEFNENQQIPVFLVSLKAGGTGLNLVGADTVIHYDMWWNPAVESQATDRVHRLGQKQSVSAYKLITLGTIEEKIAEMQKRKKGLVKKVIPCDDEAIARLTWEEVLELLQT